jgi:glycosyltransferase involved in cell wall biosynthesis
LGCRLVWGVRNTFSNAAKLGVRARVYRWLHRRLAHRANQIIYNSHRAEREYAQAGYPAAKGCTISNGFDSRRFQFDPAARAALRREWGVADDIAVFAVVGSIKPDKNHQLALEAARLVGERIPSFLLAFVGRETPEHPILGPYAAGLRNLARELQSPVIWTGENSDVARVLNAIDVLVLPSLREGTPNVVGEAMLCERPCIVADVGDAALLLGGNGTVFPPGDAAALADAMVEWASRTAEQRHFAGVAGRNRIVGAFSMEQMVDHTARLLDEGVGT